MKKTLQFYKTGCETVLDTAYDIVNKPLTKKWIVKLTFNRSLSIILSSGRWKNSYNKSFIIEDSLEDVNLERFGVFMLHI